MNTKYMKKILAAFFVGGALMATTSCSDEHMASINNDNTKTSSIDPNAQLTTCLLQTYGDFGLMDTYRSYITGFTQHMAGGWNVSNYAGSVHYNDDETRKIWDQYYNIAIKNLRDAIAHSGQRANLNAVLRIHKVYLLSVLTDTYGDVPCISINNSLEEGPSTPAYDKQEDIYNWFFEELKACVAQLGTGKDNITGDVTNYGGDLDMWKKFANSLRMRFAMRISDINPTKAQTEFEAAIKDPAGYIKEAEQDAYIKYTNGPFTLYDGARDYDFRVNALGEMLYGQDPTSPTLICSTFFYYMNMESCPDPRLYSICRHYNNVARSEIRPDKEGNVDLTTEVCDYLQKNEMEEAPCNVGAAWWNNWINAPATSELPTLQRLVEMYPEVGYDKNNFPARMLRPALSIDFEMPDRPGILFTSSEANFLLAEAITKGWNVPGDKNDLFKAGIKASMKFLNKHYLTDDAIIAETDMDTYINKLMSTNPLADETKARESINLQAWIHHMMNPAEGWANLRRADYPVLADRAKLAKFTSDFTYDDKNMNTPTRLPYPSLENKYNSVNYKEALSRIGGKDDWHQRVWWDTAEINVTEIDNIKNL